MQLSAPVPLGLTADDVFVICGQLSEADSVPALRDALFAGLKPRGFLGFTFAAIRRVKSLYLHAALCATWPGQTQSTFQQHELFNVDPVIVRSRTVAAPFVWDLSIYETGLETHARLLAFRQSLGVAGGICIPVPEAYQGRTVLYLTGDRFDGSQQAVLALQIIASYFAARLYSVGNPDQTGRLTSRNDDVGEMSPREREVFGWIATGKSSREIATIMSLSEHTVNEYIASVVGKLNASNRTEAVLRALLTHQIDLS
jgi:DNA-binding CsgD family transcriptional regulator